MGDTCRILSQAFSIRSFDVVPLPSGMFRSWWQSYVDRDWPKDEKKAIAWVVEKVKGKKVSERSLKALTVASADAVVVKAGSKRRGSSPGIFLLHWLCLLS